MSPTESQERHALVKALQGISDWLRPGTNEGANFLLTRLSDPLSTGSLFGGADISRWSAAGTRGRLDSQGGTAYALDFTKATPVTFPLSAVFDLNTGKVSLTWTPSTGAQTASFTLSLVKHVPPPNGPSYFFDAETTSDAAVYSFTVVLL
jgi:hypothetical protein